MVLTARVAPTIRRIGLPGPCIVGAGLAPNTFQRRRCARQTKPIQACHPERSAGSLSGERPCAALRMTQRDGLFFEEMSGPKAAYCCLGPRHLEIRLAVSGLERCPACHPERSEGSLRPASQILRCAQDDSQYLQMSTFRRRYLTSRLLYTYSTDHVA